MKTARAALALLAGVVLAAAPSARADTETHWNLQAVTVSGGSAWSGSYPFTIVGVILNAPGDILSTTHDSNASTNGTMGAQYQVFIQGVGGDQGGTALWMGQNYNSLGAWVPAGNSYGEANWASEMVRLAYDANTGHQFQVGDLAVVTANKSLFYGGKMNINESHRATSANDFTITLLTADYGLPAAPALALSDLYVSPAAAGYDANYPLFDSSRQTGAEHYQGTYILLTDLTLTDDSGWGQSAWADRLCTVTDGNGHTFTLRMPLTDLGVVPTGEFDAYGIVNQESGSGTNGMMGYELFVTSVVVPEPACLTMLALGVVAWMRRRRR